jgi:hypothetical protein
MSAARLTTPNPTTARQGDHGAAAVVGVAVVGAAVPAAAAGVEPVVGSGTISSWGAPSGSGYYCKT